MHVYFILMMIMTMSNLYWRWEWWRIIMMMMIWMMMSNIHWWWEWQCLLMMTMWMTMMCFVLILCIIGRVCIYDSDLLMMVWSLILKESISCMLIESCLGIMMTEWRWKFSNISLANYDDESPVTYLWKIMTIGVVPHSYGS